MKWKAHCAAVGVVFVFVSGTTGWTRGDAGTSSRALDKSAAANAVGPKRSPLIQSEAMRQDLVDRYEKLPLSFEANYGQTASAAKFLLRGKGSVEVTPITQTVSPWIQSVTPM